MSTPSESATVVAGELPSDLEAAGTPAGATETNTQNGSLRLAGIATIIGFGVSQVLRFGGNLVLWHLVTPEAFGVMALVNSLLTGLALFSDVGVGPSIVQNARGEAPEYQNTAWTIQAIRGGVVSLAATAAAYPMALFYGHEALVWYVPVASLSAFLMSFLSTRVFTAQRRVAVVRLVAIELSSQIFGTIVMVIWALFDPSVWALLSFGISSSLLQLVLSHTVLPGVRNRFAWHRESARDMLHFGQWVFVSTALTFVAFQSDRLIFGKLITLAELGVYGIAQQLAVMPAGLIDNIAQRTAFPHLSRARENPSELAQAYAKVRTPILLLGGWMIAGLIVSGPDAVLGLWGNRAWDAGWIVQILAIGTWPRVLTTLSGSTLLALGHPRLLASMQVAKVVGMAVFVPAGYALGGFGGAVWGYALSGFLVYGLATFEVERRGLRTLAPDAFYTLLLAVLCIVGVLLSTLPLPGLFESARAASLARAVALGVIVSVPFALGYIVWRRRRPA
jgi:O-antigen/teichoic acid export membrane protein